MDLIFLPYRPALGSDNVLDQQKKEKNDCFSVSKSLLKVLPAETTSLTNKVSNKTRTITQITSIDEYNSYK